MISLKSPSHAIKKILTIILVVFVLGYALFEARGLIMGPVLTIEKPLNGEIADHPVILIEGKTRSINQLSINGRSISIHENGDFSNDVVLKEGYNEIILVAKDRFGRERTETLQIMYTRNTFTGDKFTQTYEEQKDN